MLRRLPARAPGRRVPAPPCVWIALAVPARVPRRDACARAGIRTRVCCMPQDLGQLWHWDHVLRYGLLPEYKGGSGWGGKMGASYLHPSIGGHCVHTSMQAGHAPLAILPHLH